MTSSDILTKTNIDIGSTNSEEYLHHDKRGGLDKLNNPDLPGNIMKDTSLPFDRSMGCSRNSNYDEENLIQLDDSPKHRLRVRKPKIMRKEPFTPNNGNHDSCRIQDEVGFSSFVFPPAQVVLENFLEPKECVPNVATTNNPILAAIQSVSNSNKINTGANSSDGKLAAVDGVGSKNSTENIQNPMKIKATSELVCTSGTAIFSSNGTKDKQL